MKFYDFSKFVESFELILFRISKRNQRTLKNAHIQMRYFASMSVVFYAHARCSFPISLDDSIILSMLQRCNATILLTVNMTKNWTRDNQLAHTHTHTFMFFALSRYQCFVPFLDSNSIHFYSVSWNTCIYIYNIVCVCVCIDTLHRYKINVHSNKPTHTHTYNCQANVAERNRTYVDMTI